MQQVVRIGELGIPTVTRPRGREAYKRLRDRWQSGPLDVVLDGVIALPLSFLDGLLLELLSARSLEHVTFVTSEARTIKKLGRLAALHPDAMIYMREPSSIDRVLVRPAPIELEEAIYEPSKGAAAPPWPPGNSDAPAGKTREP